MSCLSGEMKMWRQAAKAETFIERFTRPGWDERRLMAYARWMQRRHWQPGTAADLLAPRDAA